MSPNEVLRKPVFSIVMPLYNKEREVGRAIRSVQAQTFSDWELIIVDDGSTDDSAKIAQSFHDPRISLVHQVNTGVSAARNRGIQVAVADWVAFLDADDEWLPTFLETVHRLRSGWPMAKVAATRYWLSPPSGRRWRARLRGLPDGWTEGLLANYFALAAASDPPLCSSAVAVERRALLEINGFPVEITSGEDLLTWARLASKCSIAYCLRPLAVFYSPGAISDRPGRRPEIPDHVSNGLADLVKSASVTVQPGMRGLLAQWHVMRATLFLELGEAAQAATELKAAKEMGNKSVKVVTLRLLTMMPGQLPRRLFCLLRWAKRQKGH
jgi:hypothetical protein